LIKYCIFLAAFTTGCATLSPVSDYKPSDQVISSYTEQPRSEALNNQRRIRVAIAVRQPSVKLVAPETFILAGFPMPRTESSLSSLPTQPPGKTLREAVLTSDQIDANGARIEPLGEGEIEVDGFKYQGNMEIVHDGKDTLTVINDVALEDYVVGVLAGEIPHDWPLEALKAQAIAARSFAFLKMLEARQKGMTYDVENTAFYQVYKGTGKVDDEMKRAVEETHGEILVYGNRPIEAYFHSNCGGHTTAAKDVWGKDEPYLRSVACDFGNNGAHYRWKAAIPIRDMIRKLKSIGIVLSDVVRISGLDLDGGDRIVNLDILDGDGRVHTIKASAFRMALGPDLVKSTHFNARVEADRVIFDGKGWGHGVGLCQEGAQGMANQGYGAFDILRHYYQGIMIQKISD
jgi:stage II sporulation protein D